MAQIIIYTKSYCPYCDRAKQLFKIKSLEFTEISVEHDQALFEEMVAKAGGRRTVPQIFINNQHIGGCDDLMLLNQTGKLDQALNN